MDIVVIIQFSTCSIFRNIINIWNRLIQRFYVSVIASISPYIWFISVFEKSVKQINWLFIEEKPENVWSVGSIPLETIYLSLKNKYKSDLNFLSLG